MKTFKYVILGSGVAAGNAAQEFVQQQVEPGQVAIVTADESLPYDRPPLSKDFLAGKKSRKEVLINPPSFYGKNGIEVLTGHKVVAVDFSEKTLRCEHGAHLKYEKLLITTGSQIKRLKVPGSELKQIYYLRFLHDSEVIRRRIKKDANVAVIGSGFIAMEVSAVVAQGGAKPTMIFRGERVWQNFFTPEISGFFQNYYKERGVTLLPNEELAAFHGRKNVAQVELKSGELYPADFVVAGVGVEPATTLFENTDLKLDHGIVVNEFLETNIPDVWAAGDVARFPDKVFDRMRRIEHWDNAVEQGKVVVRNMVGKPQPFIHVSYFFSDEFDLSWEFWGDTEENDQVVYRGDVRGGEFSAWWLQHGRVMGALVMNRPDEERELAPKWIMQRRVVDADRLRDAGQSLHEMEVDFKRGPKEEREIAYA